jgi:hypothetical protein
MKFEGLQWTEGQTPRISGGILDELKTEEGWKGVKVAWVSCTDEPTWADECMRKFKTFMGMALVERIDGQH